MQLLVSKGKQEKYLMTVYAGGAHCFGPQVIVASCFMQLLWGAFASVAGVQAALSHSVTLAQPR